MSPEIRTATQEVQDFDSFKASFEDVETKRDEYVSSRDQLGRQIDQLQTEKQIQDRNIANTNANLDRSIDDFIKETLPSLPPLVNAVFSIRLQSIWEQFTALDPSKKMTELDKIYEEVINLETAELAFANLRESDVVMGVSFRKVRTACEIESSIKQSEITAIDLTLGQIAAGTKFSIENRVHQVPDGLGSYELPFSISLVLTDVLRVGSEFSGWDDQTWIDRPRPTRSGSRLIPVVNNRPVKFVGVSSEFNINSFNQRQLILGKEAVSETLNMINQTDREKVDHSPLHFAQTYLTEMQPD